MIHKRLRVSFGRQTMKNMATEGTDALAADQASPGDIPAPEKKTARRNISAGRMTGGTAKKNQLRIISAIWKAISRDCSALRRGSQVVR